MAAAASSRRRDADKTEQLSPSGKMGTARIFWSVRSVKISRFFADEISDFTDFARVTDPDLANRSKAPKLLARLPRARPVV
jgi:hypothetical protein